MKEERLQYPVAMMCRIYDVSASGYYAWLDRPLCQRAQGDQRLKIEIKAAHKRTREAYGPERLQHDLAAHGVQVEGSGHTLQAGEEVQGHYRFEACPADRRESASSAV
jgi:hypothetical protein